MSITIYPSQFNMREDGSYVQLPAIKGEEGEQGPPGVGSLPGGTKGQVPVKQSSDDYDVAWEDMLPLLWENASPTSSFAAQTVSLDLSKYKFVLIGINGWSDDTNVTYQVCEKGKSAAHIQIRNLRSNAFRVAGFQRNIIVSDSGVEFSACVGKTDLGSTAIETQNSGLVPAKIYGVW